MKGLKAGLELFNSVPTKEDYKGDGKPTFLKDYGVLISPEAVWAKETIEEFLGEKALDGVQLNSSFHKSWKKVSEASMIQLITEQILHYVSTYGLESLGVDSKDFVYLPQEVLEVPELGKGLPLKVIKALPEKELTLKALGLFSSGMALKQQTIEAVFNLLDFLNYSWTGEEKILNKEASVMLADRKGILPTQGEELFRYFFFKATGETLVVNNEKNQKAIQSSGYEIPELTDTQILELSKSFNRLKRLWVPFKMASKGNIHKVNRISKLSKKHHVPKPPGILKTLTSGDYELSTIVGASKKAGTKELVLAINALRLYQAEEYARYYRIRNGKGHPREKENTLPKDTLHLRESLLMEELKRRLSDVGKIYCPLEVDYAIPTSEKQFAGNIPKGTKISVKRDSDYTLLTGVYWTDYGTDLDLSAINATTKVGWNSDYRTENRSLMYSGDITRAPEGGATEWMYQEAKSIDQGYLITLNRYSSKVHNPRYKIILALSNKKKIERNYICNPNEVVVQAETQVVQKQTILGLLLPEEEFLNFYISDIGSPGGRTSIWGENEDIVQRNLLGFYTSQLRLSDLFELERNPENKDQCDIDLTPNQLNKDTLMSLFDK